MKKYSQRELLEEGVWNDIKTRAKSGYNRAKNKAKQKYNQAKTKVQSGVNQARHPLQTIDSQGGIVHGLKQSGSGLNRLRKAAMGALMPKTTEAFRDLRYGVKNVGNIYQGKPTVSPPPRGSSGSSSSPGVSSGAVGSKVTDRNVINNITTALTAKNLTLDGTPTIAGKDVRGYDYYSIIAFDAGRNKQPLFIDINGDPPKLT